MSWYDLAGNWDGTEDGGAHISRIFKVDVPGTIQAALINELVIEDPVKNQNELKQTWIAESDWTLSRKLPALDTDRTHHLVLDGLDTLGEIFIDERKIGETCNEFRKWTFVIPPNSGGKALTIRFKSTTKYCIEQQKKHFEQTGYTVPCSQYVNGGPDWNFIRKCHCSFGWDWGPCVPVIGIHGSIGIVSFSNGYIQNMKVLVHPVDHEAVTNDKHVPRFRVDVTLYYHLQHPKKEIKFKFELIETDHNRSGTESRVTKEFELTAAQEASISFGFEVNTDAWLPNGFLQRSTNHGLHETQHRKFNKTYKLRVLHAEESQVFSRNLGFRKVELLTKRDDGNVKIGPFELPAGVSFFLKINDIPVFAKGANYIPPDTIPGRRKDDWKRLLRDSVDANMNCLRIWGGGRYETDEFYTECDKLGIMLWHDMMYACTLYPADADYLNNVRMEIQDQLRRLSGHPCIVMWAGNNENEELLISKYNETPEYKEQWIKDYKLMNMETILPEYLNEMGSSVPFWPSSPSNGVGEWGNPADPTRGDVHFWSVWHGNQPFSAYENVKPRFCSEFGFQSMPNYYDCLHDISTNAEDLNLSSPIMEFRQRSPVRGNLAILSQMFAHFRLPLKPEMFCYASQVLQGLALKLGVESWRRLSPYNMGTLYWQLNDDWTGFSWSTINYSGSWKLSHYFVRRFYSPLHLSFQVHLKDSNRSNPPSTEDPPFEKDDVINLWIYQDDLGPSQLLSMKVIIDLIEINPSVNSYAGTNHVSSSSSALKPSALQSLSLDIEINSTSRVLWSSRVCELLNLASSDNLLIRARIFDNAGSLVGENEHILVPFKRINLPRPTITLTLSESIFTDNDEQYPEQIQSLVVRVDSDQLVLYFALEDILELPGRWSDNAVNIYPGEPRFFTYSVFNRNSINRTHTSHLQVKLDEELSDIITQIRYRHLHSSYHS